MAKNVCPIGKHSDFLYGLPKVYKIVIDNVPKFRLTLSAIGTPVYNQQNFWSPFYHHLQLMNTPSKIHFPLLKKLLILFIVFL